jgi:hypothetical protein
LIDERSGWMIQPRMPCIILEGATCSGCYNEIIFVRASIPIGTRSGSSASTAWSTERPSDAANATGDHASAWLRLQGDPSTRVSSVLSQTTRSGTTRRQQLQRRADAADRAYVRDQRCRLRVITNEVFSRSPQATALHSDGSLRKAGIASTGPDDCLPSASRRWSASRAAPRRGGRGLLQPSGNQAGVRRSAHRGRHTGP